MDNVLESRTGLGHRRDRARRRRAEIEHRHTRGDPVRRYRIARAHADMARRRFDNAGLSVGTSVVVHAVRWRVGETGVEHPAPACHVGTDRPDSDPSVRPVYDRPVDCKLCLRRRVAIEDGQPYIPAAGQFQLYSDSDGVPALSAFPPTTD